MDQAVTYKDWSVDDYGRLESRRAKYEDGALVSSFLDGEASGFEALYGRYHQRLVAFCSRQTRTWETAEDLAHDIVVKALNALEDFDSSRAMWPWLKTVARNTLIDHYRASSHTVDVPDEYLPESDPKASDHTTLVCQREALDEAMDAVPDGDRVILELRYREEWTSERLQEKLGIGRDALHKRLQRARDRLRNAYGS